jgi:hypothetical protein
VPHLTALRSRPVLITWLVAAHAAAEDPPPPYAQALHGAIAAAQTRIERGLSLWEDHSTWDHAWQARSEHFVVRTTSSHGTAVDIANGLETMLGHFQDTLAIDHAPASPWNVFVLPDVASYNQFGEQHGEHHSSFYGSFHAAGHPEKPVAAIWVDNPLWLRMQITHSVVHQYLDSAFPGRARPTWLDEGLAAYFSIFWDYSWALQEFEQLRDQQKLPGLPRLLRDGIDAYGPDMHARLMQLGMLFYWLLRYRDDTRTTSPGEQPQRAPFRDYVRALLEGRPTDGLPCAALFNDPEALDRELRAFAFPR